MEERREYGVDAHCPWLYSLLLVSTLAMKPWAPNKIQCHHYTRNIQELLVKHTPFLLEYLAPHLSLYLYNFLPSQLIEPGDVYAY